MTVCRRMTLPELRLELDWAAGEGWNSGHGDVAGTRLTAPACHGP